MAGNFRISTIRSAVTDNALADLDQVERDWRELSFETFCEMYVRPALNQLFSEAHALNESVPSGSPAEPQSAGTTKE